MKIQLLSDTHGSPYTLHPEADVIAHAGDFGNGLAAMRQFQAACNEAGKPYVFVLGNHDYYHENMSDVRLQLRDEPYLRAGKTVQINGWTFVGGTLFSNFRQHQVSAEQFEQNCHLAQVSVADFAYIFDYLPNSQNERRSTPEDYVHLYNEEWAWIQRFRGAANTIVLTHFPPNAACTAPQFAESPLNPYFINDVDLTGFAYWFAGHTHTAMDANIQGCRVVINPLGYPDEIGRNGYWDGYLIEV